MRFRDRHAKMRAGVIMNENRTFHDAMLWSSGDGGAVRCNLCAHRCKIQEGDFGRCRVRHNAGGVLKTLTYDRVMTINVDPIEKKPLFHFLPGTRSLSIAAPGCNFTCDFCQNWRLSQLPRESNGLAGKAIAPAAIVETALSNGCRSISYTYSEPTVFFELAHDTAAIAAEKGLKNCFVSNGFMTPEAVREIAPVLDAINVDLKCFSEDTYRDVIGGTLTGVLECIGCLVEAGIWVEITTLVVPGMNDSSEELRRIADWIVAETGPAIPWHVSRFHGDYHMETRLPTDPETLQMAAETGSEAGLKYVYCGNMHGVIDERTLCSNCGTVIIDRRGFTVRGINLAGSCCPDCGETIRGVWE